MESLPNSASQDLQEMTSFWNPKLAHGTSIERFETGASLWLIKSADKLAGYGWTLQGRTIEPYYFPLGKDDVHLFDFHVFPQYRGQGNKPVPDRSYPCVVWPQRAAVEPLLRQQSGIRRSCRLFERLPSGASARLEN